MKTRPCAVASILLSMLSGGPLARAQCDQLMPGPPTLMPPGVNQDGGVGAITSWDPDGAGPEEPMLVVAGLFTQIAGISVTNIAGWNGVHWVPLGDPGGGVDDLTVFNGNLIACGSIPGNVARWVPGQGWQQFALPLAGSGVLGVRALTVFGGQLIAGGEFGFITGVPANNIARWNGSMWLALGSGVGGGSFPDVQALAVYNNELVAAGRFTTAGGVSAANIARWNGSAWQALGSGISAGAGAVPDVHALTVHQGWLIAGGGFTTAGGVGTSRIARWNGSSWASLGTGLAPAVFGTEVRSMAVHNGWLIVGGKFDSAGSVFSPGIASWSGTNWVSMGIGLQHPLGAQVNTVGAHFSGAYVGGSFDGAGGHTANHLARWTSTEWLAVESPWFVHALTPFGSKIAAAGQFAFSTGPATPAAYHIATWDGLSLSSIGGGLNRWARALMSFTQPGPFGDTELIVGGDFTAAGGVAANRIARWVEDPFVGFPPPEWQPMGAGFNDSVYAIERFFGSTVAAGLFTASGATPLNRIARWSGTDWQPISSGLNDAVLALKPTPGTTPLTTSLVVGGAFTSAGGVAANRIARWTESFVIPGGSWGAMGAGFDGTVRAIERFNDETYAAGEFTASGPVIVDRIARWTGSSWVPVGGGFNGPVYALRTMDGYLYAAGAFTAAGGAPAERIARWDGASWSPVDGGAVSSVFALAPYRGEMHVGGFFWAINGGSPSAAGWARYTPTGAPWIATHPLPQSIECGGEADFTVAAAPGYNGVQIQWQKDGVPLTNGPTASGSLISGATTPQLTITGASQADQGSYDAVVSTSCGGAISGAADLTVTGNCPGVCYADCNTDGALTVSDFGCFQTKFVAGDPYADCNEDGVQTVADFGCFQTKFVAGCP